MKTLFPFFLTEDRVVSLLQRHDPYFLERVKNLTLELYPLTWRSSDLLVEILGEVDAMGVIYVRTRVDVQYKSGISQCGVWNEPGFSLELRLTPKEFASVVEEEKMNRAITLFQEKEEARKADAVLQCYRELFGEPPVKEQPCN